MKFKTRTDKFGKTHYRAEVFHKGQRESRWCSTHDEAKAWHAATLTAMRKGQIKDTSAAQKKTLSELLQEFSDDVASYRRTRRTSDDEVKRIEFLMRFDIAKKKLADLTRADVKAFKTKRRETVTEATVSREITIFRSAVEYARDPDEGLDIYMAENVFKALTRKRRTTKNQSQSTGRDRLLTQAEVDALRTAFKTRKQATELLLAFELARQTGLRKAELLGLKFGDVSGNVLSVARVADRDSETGEYLETLNTKNGKSGLVPLTPDAIHALASMEQGGPDERIFKSLTYYSLTCAFKRSVKAAGLVDFRWHDLRHVAITGACELLNGDAFALKEFARHSDVRMTAKYTHMVASRIADRFANAQQTQNVMM